METEKYQNIKIQSEDIDRNSFSINNLSSLKESFPDLDNDTLARYLIAKNNDYIAAFDQLTRSENLRKEYTHVKKAQCLHEIAKGKAYIHGHDKQGRPLMIIHLRKHDLEDRDLNEMIKMTMWWVEQAIHKMPKNCSRFTVLVDRSDCEKQVDSEYLQHISGIFQVGRALLELSPK